MADKQQQERGAPEESWIPFIRSMYPYLLQRPHFFPPLFFNRVPHTVTRIDRQVARLHVNPPPPSPSRSRHRRRARSNPPPPPALSPLASPRRSASSSSSSSSPSHSSSSPAGAVFTANPADLKDQHFQDSDLRDDEAQYQCFHALESIDEVMMVISQMKFRKYLDNQHNPQHHVNPTSIISQLPSINHPFIPQSIADGECDVIILHREYGILVGEIKSVGGQYLSQKSPRNQNQIIARRILKAIGQLEDQELALKHLVGDMVGGNVRVTKALLLPNVSRAQLTSAVHSSQQLRKALCWCTHTQDVRTAVSRCLCADHMREPHVWWHNVWAEGPDLFMSDTVYERLVARFCGPASTVDVPTAGHPRKVLRAFGEAVAETGLRFSSLVLTLEQVALLNAMPGPRYVYLQGPPGCGKTVVLVLRALQWASRGRKVVVVGRPINAAVTILVEEQLRRILGEAATTAGSVQRLCIELEDIRSDMSQLMQVLGTSSEAFILFDEVPRDRDQFLHCLTAVRRRLPGVCVWAAGLYRWDHPKSPPPPPWLRVCTLREPLRCPPNVTRKVQSSSIIDGVKIPRYGHPMLPVPTEGPAVHSLQHRGQRGHRGGEPWECLRCADVIGHILTQELRVGQPGHPHYRDTWVLCQFLPAASDAEVLVRRLRHTHHVPVRAVSLALTVADARELALAVTDQVIVTDYSNVQGLERTVIIALGDYVGAHFESYSRSTSFLGIIF